MHTFTSTHKADNTTAYLLKLPFRDANNGYCSVVCPKHQRYSVYYRRKLKLAIIHIQEAEPDEYLLQKLFK